MYDFQMSIEHKYIFVYETFTINKTDNVRAQYKLHVNSVMTVEGHS